jgi:uncharacterized protein (DUF362 family)
MERLFLEAGWDGDRAGALSWNPLREFIRPGDFVVLKPNWIFHSNPSGQGTDCLITHASVVGAVLDFVLRAKPARVVVGDAPIQGCDFSKLLDVGGYAPLKAHYARLGAPVAWMDFRRTILRNSKGTGNRQVDARPMRDYVLFDLGTQSLLEPIAEDAERFRVTMYNPDLMRQTHGLGRHQYLISRQVIEADVIINLPKLKTHNKAGITGALKNLVGINGNKDFLPHHRFGGSRRGGDCYAGRNLFKLAAEHLSDAANRREGGFALMLRQAMRGCCGLARLTGTDSNLEGSWHGNDTVWRTCLDLNRLLIYGRPDATLASTPQRKLLSITDAIICGEGEGPLAPVPHPLGILSMAINPASADYVHAHLMGFDWRNIHIIREAFGGFGLSIAHFRPEDIEIQFDGKRFRQPWPGWAAVPFLPPKGWKGHCERTSR